MSIEEEPTLFKDTNNTDIPAINTTQIHASSIHIVKETIDERTTYTELAKPKSGLEMSKRARQR